MDCNIDNISMKHECSDGEWPSLLLDNIFLPS